jgi:hypothetical protein
LPILPDESAAALNLVAAAIVRDENNPSDYLDVGSLPALGTLRYLKADFLPFLEGFETVYVNRGEVREQVISPIVGSDKTKAFFVVEPFNCTCCHVTLSLRLKKLLPVAAWPPSSSTPR